jgi:hypothetical protein
MLNAQRHAIALRASAAVRWRRAFEWLRRRAAIEQGAEVEMSNPGLTVADLDRVSKLETWSAPWVVADFASVVHNGQDAAHTTQQNCCYENN